MAIRPLILKAKLVPKDIDNPKKIAALKDDVQTFVLGQIFGIATEVVERLMPQPNGDTVTFYGLGGQFKAIPADETRPIVQSGVMFLPSIGILEKIADALEAGETDIKLAFEIAVRRASNPAGYEWVFSPLMDVEDPSDPLTILQTECAEHQKRLAAPAPVAQLAAPVKGSAEENAAPAKKAKAS